MAMKSPAERWEECQNWMEAHETDEPPRRFAINQEGDHIWFDDNWVPLFLVTDEAGTIRAMNPDGTTEDIYCEPVWLSGWSDWAFSLPTEPTERKEG